ncbi:hypothetical protein EDC01DRAFT_623762 [Geopyxis carbonaria]|nr:hypothetical protein EDC01DRAFT_623762 [Geopyxis carbonaria]
MIIRAVCPGIFTLSVPFLRFGKVKFGGRATLVKLQSGGLVVVSPVSLTKDVEETIQSLGGVVSYLVAPDIEHHMQLGPWKKRFGTAKVIGPEGLRQKRASQGDEDVVLDYELTKQNKRELQLPKDFTDDFTLEYWDSHANKEIVLLHKPTRTLIQADLLFNLPPNEQFSRSGVDPSSGIINKVAQYFLNAQGTGQQRFIWYALAKDKVSFQQSARIVSTWNFDRIIPCHGDVIETGGSAVFKRLFAWHL